MVLSQAPTTRTAGVPCPQSGHVAETIADAVTCPHCRRWVQVEQDPWGVWSYADHETRQPVDRALDLVARKVRQIVNGHPAYVGEPDVVDLAHAAEILDSLSSDPNLLFALWRKATPQQSHLSTCTDRDYCRGECLAGSEPF